MFQKLSRAWHAIEGLEDFVRLEKRSNCCNQKKWNLSTSGFFFFSKIRCILTFTNRTLQRNLHSRRQTSLQEWKGAESKRKRGDQKNGDPQARSTKIWHLNSPQLLCILLFLGVSTTCLKVRDLSLTTLERCCFKAAANNAYPRNSQYTAKTVDFLIKQKPENDVVQYI